MGVKLPESYTDLSLEDLKSLRDDVVAEAKEIDTKGEKLSKEDVDRLEVLLDALGKIDATTDELVEAEAAETERATSARSRLAAIADSDASEPDEGVEAVDPAAEAVDEGADDAGSVDEPIDSVEKEQEAVVASGSRRSTASIAARRAPKQAPPAAQTAEQTFVVTAAADVPEFGSGQTLEGTQDIAKAFLARVAGGPQNDGQMATRVIELSNAFTRKGVARIKRKNAAFSVDGEMSVEDQFSTIMEAAREKRLQGGSLIAAGGWGAPSENIYDLFGLETQAGLLDIPEVTAGRGGINFTKGPDFSTIFADVSSGFIQTEAQAEAGTTKVCYAVDSPPFTEVRLDAIGFCMTAGILTNAGYPELVRRTLDLLGIGHARRKNQSTISRISTLIGAAINWVEVGAVGGTSGTADALEALEFQALRLRQQFAMDPGATMEGIAPFWFRSILRADLSRRTGVDMLNVTDQMIDNFLSARGIRLQYVYDYQMLTEATTGTWTTFPSTVEIMLYPAGAYVRLVKDVISLDAVYDHDMLTGNEYTAAFMEEGLAVANTVGSGVKVSIAFNRTGATGYPAIGAGEGVTIPVVP